jgi:hypothetical protein
MEIIRAREAFDRGLKRYFSGEPCKHGHIAERMISNGGCVECLNARRQRDREKIYERTKIWRKKNPGARTEEARRYRNKHPEKVKANSQRYREQNIDKVRERDKLAARRIRALNPDKEKARLLRWAQRREEKRLREAGRERPDSCEICNLNEFRIVFDHCHISGKFRGWICDRCNRTLGIVKDSSELLIKMSEYLETHNVKDNIEST